MDIRLREGGAKRRLNGTSKGTDRRTNTQTDRRTFRLIENIGPEGRRFENLVVYIKLLDFVDFTVQAAKSGIGPIASRIFNLTQSIGKKK